MCHTSCHRARQHSPSLQPGGADLAAPVTRLLLAIASLGKELFRVIGEYRSARRAALRDPSTGDSLFVGGAPQPATEFNGLRLDLLASFEPTPGTVAFLGYGSSLESDREFNWSRLERVNDGFFVKLAYQVRRSAGQRVSGSVGHGEQAHRVIPSFSALLRAGSARNRPGLCCHHDLEPTSR